MKSMGEVIRYSQAGCNHPEYLHFEARRTCTSCGLPMGVPIAPLPDCAMTPAVAIEVRAAELADLASSHATSMESSGWSAHRYDNGPLDHIEWHAGWLGREIHEHGRP